MQNIFIKYTCYKTHNKYNTTHYISNTYNIKYNQKNM
nr:MAG TPA: hypothetical protein [Caudoviricetes sp.]